MAKMFYTLDEAKAALGKNDEEIKQFAREGRLREFRDGQRLMFKADQVESLRAEIAEGNVDAKDLGPSDSGSAMAIGLADSSKGMSGTGLTLVDESGRSPGAGMTLKEDTALAAGFRLERIGRRNALPRKIGLRHAQRTQRNRRRNGAGKQGRHRRFPER